MCWPLNPLSSQQGDLINTRDLISDVIIMEDMGEQEMDPELLGGSGGEGTAPGGDTEPKSLLQETHMALQQFSIGKKIT